MTHMAVSVLANIITNQSKLIRGVSFNKNQQCIRDAAMLLPRNYSRVNLNLFLA